MDTLDKKILAFWLIMGIGGLLVGLVGCSGNWSYPPLDGQCSPTGGVRTCAGTQMRDGTQCALCDDANLTLSCAFGGHYATCVADCSACDQEPVRKQYTDGQTMGLQSGIFVCGATKFTPGPLRYRESTYCALCGYTSVMSSGTTTRLDASLTADYCPPDGGGFCSPVVCVATCDTCAPVPPSGG